MATIKYNPNELITEGDVESKFIQELITKILGYDLSSDLKWKETVKFKQGRSSVSKQADLVVYKNNIPVLVVEAKNPTESCMDNIEQTDSYAFAKEVRYSLTINGRRLILREYLAGNKKNNIINDSIDKLHKLNYASLIKAISKNNINNDINNAITYSDDNESTSEITDYRRFFRSIHNIIRDNEKLDPLGCFDEFSKILYLKMADNLYRTEKIKEKYFDLKAFKNVPGKDAMELVNEWFNKAMKHYYTDVFEEIPSLNVSITTLETVLDKLDGQFKFKDDKMDIKGKAFEEFLPSQLRGKGLGQFFTPRPIVDFMVNLANVEINDVVIDFACGSGGFLIKSFDKMNQTLRSLPESTFKSIGTTKADFEEKIKKNQIFGIDAEPKAVRIAKMNMMLWGDGKKIIRGNGLDDLDWQGKPYPLAEYDESVNESGCTLILANPPFIKEKDKKILAKYELAEGRNSVDAQTLFIEKGLRYLRPSGRMLIVLPEGVLSNPDSIKTREYILRNAKIKAIIELPKHTFVQSGVDTINTVVLYLEKYESSLKQKVNSVVSESKTPLENIRAIQQIEDLHYEIFIGSTQNVGFEPNGRIFAKDDTITDLDVILEKYFDKNRKPIKYDLISISLESEKEESSKAVWKKSFCDYMQINISSLESRFDPAFYLFWKNIGNKFDKFVPLGDYVVKEVKTKFKKPKSDSELDAEYQIFAVNKNEPNGIIEYKECKTGEEIAKESQTKLILSKDSIVYNPYRANIGSFAIVDEKADKGLTSGVYVQFKVEKYNLELLSFLFKSPIYNKYITVLANGTVRDNFSPENLKTILVPKLNEKQQLNLLKEFKKKRDSINEKYVEIFNENIDRIESMYSDIGLMK